jgi:hypothetical protein
MKRICLHCRNHFRLSKFHHNQNYCNNKECQRARKSLWQKIKIKEDSAYKDNQKDALHCWREKHPSIIVITGKTILNIPIKLGKK